MKAHDITTTERDTGNLHLPSPYNYYIELGSWVQIYTQFKLAT